MMSSLLVSFLRRNILSYLRSRQNRMRSMLPGIVCGTWLSRDEKICQMLQTSKDSKGRMLEVQHSRKGLVHQRHWLGSPSRSKVRWARQTDYNPSHSSSGNWGISTSKSKSLGPVDGHASGLFVLASVYSCQQLLMNISKAKDQPLFAFEVVNDLRTQRSTRCPIYKLWYLDNKKYSTAVLVPQKLKGYVRIR